MTLKSPTLIFVLGLIVGAGLASYVWSTGILESVNQPPPAAATTTNQLPPQSSAVSVSNQAAGSSVVVDAVTVAPPGVWVAVQELGSDNTLGNVLGAARVRGPRSNVTVTLLRDTVPAHRYAVVLYRDDGDEAFTLSGDSAYIDFDTGDRVIAPFMTLAN